MKSILAAVCLCLVVACGSDGSTATTVPPSTAPPAVCTEIGCNSGLRVELADADLTADSTYSIDICIGEECVQVEVGPGHTGEITSGADPSTLEGGSIFLDAEADRVELMLGFVEFDPIETVSFSITDVATGEVMASTGGEDVPFERSQPNGPGCPPVCFFGRLSL